MVPPKPRLSLRTSLNPGVQGAASHRSELAGKIKRIHPPLPRQEAVQSAPAPQRPLLLGLLPMLPGSLLVASGLPVGRVSPEVPWLRFQRSFPPALAPITNTKHQFLKSLFLLFPRARWNWEHCLQPGCLDCDFAQTLAPPLRHHTLAAPTFGLTLCSDFCSHGMPPTTDPMVSAAISCPGTTSTGTSSLSNRPPALPFLLPCAWLASELTDSPARLTAGHPGISHRRSF